MTKADIIYTIGVDKKVEIFTDMIQIMNGICELVPDWRAIELEYLSIQLVDRLGKLIEQKTS